MSEDLPQSSRPPIQRSFRKQFFSVTDALAMQGTTYATVVDRNDSQRLQQLRPSPLLHSETSGLPVVQGKSSNHSAQRVQDLPLPPSEQPQEASRLPAVNGNRHGNRRNRQFKGQWIIQSVPLQKTFLLPTVQTVQTPPKQRGNKGLTERNRTWRPGTFGFESKIDLPALDDEDTFSMMVLKGISKQQGQPAPVMQSEISGAASGAAIVGVGTIAGNVFKYGNNFMIQRAFGPGPYGLYTLSFAIVTLISSIFNLGLDDAMVRYSSVYKSKKQPRLLRGLAIFCSASAGMAGLLGAIILFYMTPYIAHVRGSDEIVPLLLIMAPIIPFTCMQVIWSAGLQGFKAFKWRVLTQRLLIPGVLLVLLVPVLLFFRTISSVAIALLLSILFCTLISLFFFFRQLTTYSSLTARGFDLREWIGFAIPNFLTSIVDTVLDSVDTVLLAVFAISNVAIGQYGAAIRIAIFVSMPLQSFNTMFSPTIAELYSKGEKQKLSAMFKIVTKWALTFSLPIFWIAVLFSEPLLAISGSGFAPAWPLLIALAIGNLINVATGSVGYMLLMTGHQKITFLNSLVAILFNIALGVILIPHFGAMGVAIATAVALSVVNLMRLLQVYIFLRMTPFRWDTLKPIAAGVLSALVTGGLNYLLSLTKLSLHISKYTLSLELALIPVFIALYVGLLYILKVSPEDQVVLDALRKKLKRGKK
jgi:O-antigen/teichoic acid export membrane protein